MFSTPTGGGGDPSALASRRPDLGRSRGLVCGGGRGPGARRLQPERPHPPHRHPEPVVVEPGLGRGVVQVEVTTGATTGCVGLLDGAGSVHTYAAQASSPR